MSDEKAEQLMKEAEKQATKFAPFTSSEEKYEKAREKYLQAATMYKASSNFAGAAKAYLKAAELSHKLKEEMDESGDMFDAGRALQKIKDPRSEELFSKCVEIFDKNGKYSQAAKTCVAIADEGGENALEWYQRAMKYYKSEGSRATAQELNLKVANMYIKKGELGEAKQIFDRAGREALDDRLTRGSARKYFFMSLLCYIGMLSPTNVAEGTAALQERFEEYQELDTQFTGHTREHMLIAQIIAALEESSIDAYSEAMDEYDTICPLDETKTKLLLRGKQVLRQSDIR